MAYAIDLECAVHEDGPGYCIELTIKGLPTKQSASDVAMWVRDALRENASKIGFLDPTASRTVIEPRQ